jgi:hypothetical protein
MNDYECVCAHARVCVCVCVYRCIYKGMSVEFFEALARKIVYCLECDSVQSGRNHVSDEPVVRVFGIS